MPRTTVKTWIARLTIYHDQEHTVHFCLEERHDPLRYVLLLNGNVFSLYTSIEECEEEWNRFGVYHDIIETSAIL
jgi:hypothetical protein